MHELALYRKYRPKTFKEVLGQEHIVDVLESSIGAKKVSHAYLFVGSRGTGKTSVARIFATEIGVSANDMYEIDAASNRGIEDIKELRDGTRVLPFNSKYKIYIIDEVHMLSKDAWNALLKTLEEPPKHVIFILATTELDKVPETIVSRCQTFSFRKPAREVLRKEIIRISKKEGYELDAGASELLALLGDGSFRDALGMLEKVIASSADKKLSCEEVEKITGAPRAGLVNQFIENVISKNEDGALAILGQVGKSGISINTFVILVLEKMRFIMLAGHSTSSHKEIEARVSPDDWLFIKEQGSKKLLTPKIMLAFLDAAEEVSRAKIEILPLELAVVKVCQ